MGEEQEKKEGSLGDIIGRICLLASDESVTLRRILYHIFRNWELHDSVETGIFDVKLMRSILSTKWLSAAMRVEKLGIRTKNHSI